jgi:hypothetical protein
MYLKSSISREGSACPLGPKAVLFRLAKFLLEILYIGRCFSPDTPYSSTTKTGHHHIAEILPKMALNTINLIMDKIMNMILYIVDYHMTYNIINIIVKFQQVSSSKRKIYSP